MPARFRIAAWLATERGLASSVLEGEIMRQTSRAYHVRAHALIRESERCHRCHQPIDNPASRLLGYGPICAGYLGLPHAEVYAAMSREERQAVLDRATRSTEVEIWLPKSAVEVELDYPCYARTRDQWCDRDGPGGFMGHSCRPQVRHKVVRVITYQGNEDWISRMIDKALPDGKHEIFGEGGFIKIQTTERPAGLKIGEPRSCPHESH